MPTVLTEQQCLAFGLMIRFRGTSNSLGDLAMMQVLKGLGLGLISFPTQNAVQVASKHEHIALIVRYDCPAGLTGKTASWLAMFYISQAIGSSIGGAIWSATLPPRLTEALGGNATLANTIYANPISWIMANGFDNPQRQAVAQAYSDAQRFILIAATCVGFIVILCALGLANPHLGDTVTLPAVEANGDGEHDVVRPGVVTGRPEVDGSSRITKPDDRSLGKSRSRADSSHSSQVFNPRRG